MRYPSQNRDSAPRVSDLYTRDGGEDTTLHAVACGRIGDPPEVRCTPDPRRRTDQFKLFRWLGTKIEGYFGECRETGAYPQLWVSSGAAADHLTTLAERQRRNRDDMEVKRAGELLSYATDRYPVAGQQALQTATGALTQHWATGQDEGEDEHLGAVLAWIEPPKDHSVLAAVAEAERRPMGFKTDPEFDRNVLGPLVQSFNGERRNGAPYRVQKARFREIAQALVPVVKRIYQETQRATAVLQGMNLPPLPALEQLEHRESREFQDFMNSRDAGYPITLTDRPRAAAFKLSAREEAEQNFEAALMTQDGVARAQGRFSGRILCGEVENLRRVRIAPWRFRYLFDLVSDQQELRVRRGDELCMVDDRRFVVVVEDVVRERHTTRLSVRILQGMRAVGLPPKGVTLELSSRVPDWDRLRRERMHLRRRLAQTPWTHSSETSPPVTRRRRRNTLRDPLAAIEELR